MASTSGDKVIAKACDTCCLKGTIHEGEPRGRFETISGVNTYISEPQDGKGNGNVVIYYPDVFGFFTNGFLIMDGLADAGYLTIGIDYFQGDAVNKHFEEPGFDMWKWIEGKLPFSNDIVPKWTNEVKSKFGSANTKFACTGYCYGAPYVMDQLSEKGVCSAGAFAHPAFLKESHFFNLTKPLFLSCAETDMTFGTEFRNRAIEILMSEKKQFQLQLFSGVEHGFALRGDNSPHARYTKEQSLKGIAEWFDYCLAQESVPAEKL